MRKVTVTNNVTLDGVMQAPAVANEDTRGGLGDEFVLLIHPLVLGSGTRLFPDAGTLATLSLVESVPTTKGVIIATYRRESRIGNRESRKRTTTPNAV